MQVSSSGGKQSKDSYEAVRMTCSVQKLFRSHVVHSLSLLNGYTIFLTSVSGGQHSTAGVKYQLPSSPCLWNRTIGVQLQQAAQALLPSWGCLDCYLVTPCRCVKTLSEISNFLDFSPASYPNSPALGGGFLDVVDALCVRYALHQPLHIPAAQNGVGSQPQAEPFTLEDVVDKLNNLAQRKMPAEIGGLLVKVAVPNTRC